MNLYDDGGMSVGWHSDDESLFQGKFRDINIISLSLGVTRNFELRRNWPEAREDNVARMRLQSGDIMTMEGMLQKHFQHRVPKEECVEAPRINLTWRWVVKHMPKCPQCRNRGNRDEEGGNRKRIKDGGKGARSQADGHRGRGKGGKGGKGRLGKGRLGKGRLGKDGKRKREGKGGREEGRKHRVRPSPGSNQYYDVDDSQRDSKRARRDDWKQSERAKKGSNVTQGRVGLVPPSGSPIPPWR